MTIYNKHYEYIIHDTSKLSDALGLSHSINTLTYDEYLLSFEEYTVSYFSNKGSAHSVEHRLAISLANKGKTSDTKKAIAKHASEVARQLNIGKKRPDHSKIMKDRYKEGRLGICGGMQKEKHPLWGIGHKDSTKRKISEATKHRTLVCCIKCHKYTKPEGIWMCHYTNHHKNC